METVRNNPSCLDRRIVESEPLGQTDGQSGPCFVRLRIEAPAWDDWKPGQFVMLRSPAFSDDVTWARPFCIGHADESGLDLYIQALGRGSSRLAALTPGAPVTLWGPLGRGFEYAPEDQLLILAGGMGIAPFVGLVKTHSNPGNISFFFGHREELACYPFAEFEQRCPSLAMREQGPEDLQRVIQQLEQRIGAHAASNSGPVLACGPKPFLKTVQRIALQHKTPAQLSLEERMACGVGACLGCAVLNDQGWPVSVCAKGPVFDAQEVDLG